jgi:hypothetical protein
VMKNDELAVACMHVCVFYPHITDIKNLCKRREY